MGKVCPSSGIWCSKDRTPGIKGARILERGFRGLGFLGFRGLGFRGLGFWGLSIGL